MAHSESPTALNTSFGEFNTTPSNVSHNNTAVQDTPLERNEPIQSNGSLIPESAATTTLKRKLNEDDDTPSRFDENGIKTLLAKSDYHIFPIDKIEENALLHAGMPLVFDVSIMALGLVIIAAVIRRHTIAGEHKKTLPSFTSFPCPCSANCRNLGEHFFTRKGEIRGTGGLFNYCSNPETVGLSAKFFSEHSANDIGNKTVFASPCRASKIHLEQFFSLTALEWKLLSDYSHECATKAGRVMKKAKTTKVSDFFTRENGADYISSFPPPLGHGWLFRELRTVSGPNIETVRKKIRKLKSDRYGEILKSMKDDQLDGLIWMVESLKGHH